MKRYIGLVLVVSNLMAVSVFQTVPLRAAHVPIDGDCEVQQNCEAIYSELNGFKYYDENRNAVYDDGEQLLSDWQITLYDAQWQPIHQTVTDSEGAFQMSVNLAEEAYYLCEENRSEWLQLEPVTVHFLSDGNSSCYLIEGEPSQKNYPFGNIPKSDIADELNGGQIIGVSDSATPKEPQSQGEVLGESVLAETGDATLIAIISSVTIIVIAITISLLSKRQSNWVA